MTGAAPGGGTLGSGVGYMLDAGATTCASGDLPGICGGMTSMGWQHGGLGTWSIRGGAQDAILATCTVALP
jgi:hypothetical protein